MKIDFGVHMEVYKGAVPLNYVKAFVSRISSDIKKKNYRPSLSFPKLYQNICLLNIYLCKKTIALAWAV